MAWGPQKLEKDYCPKLGHCVAAMDVCERRSKPYMKPMWPKCEGCKPEDVLTERGEHQNLSVYSEPPPMWFNIPRYIETLGEDVCAKYRGTPMALGLGKSDESEEPKKKRKSRKGKKK